MRTEFAILRKAGKKRQAPGLDPDWRSWYQLERWRRIIQCGDEQLGCLRASQTHQSADRDLAHSEVRMAERSAESKRLANRSAPREPNRS